MGKPQGFCLGGGHLTHFPGKIRTVHIDAAFRQIKQNGTRAAGHIHHTAGTVFAGQIQVKLLESFVMIRSLGVHDLKISVVVLGNIPEIVQIHGTPPRFFLM